MDEPITAHEASEDLAQQPEQNAPGDAEELDVAYAQGDFARLRTRARVLRDDASQPETLRKRAGPGMLIANFVPQVPEAFPLRAEDGVYCCHSIRGRISTARPPSRRT